MNLKLISLTFLISIVLIESGNYFKSADPAGLGYYHFNNALMVWI